MVLHDAEGWAQWLSQLQTLFSLALSEMSLLGILS